MTASRNLTLMACRRRCSVTAQPFADRVGHTGGLLGIDPAIIESARDMVPAEGVKLLQLHYMATRSTAAGYIAGHNRPTALGTLIGVVPAGSSSRASVWTTPL